MKAKYPKRIISGQVSLLVPLLIIVFSSVIAFDSCKKEELLPKIEINQIKSSLHKSEGTSIFIQNEIFVRKPGKPVNIIRIFGNAGLIDYQGCPILNVQNGVNGIDFVSAAVIKIDGVTMLKQSDFKNCY